jgi:hypothetical protein
LATDELNAILIPVRSSLVGRGGCFTKEDIRTFIVPVGSRLRLKPLEHAVGRVRNMRRSVKDSLFGPDRVCQRTEQRQVVSATKEEDLFVRFIRQHPQILITVRLLRRL